MFLPLARENILMIAYPPKGLYSFARDDFDGESLLFYPFPLLGNLITKKQLPRRDSNSACASRQIYEANAGVQSDLTDYTTTVSLSPTAPSVDTSPLGRI